MPSGTLPGWLTALLAAIMGSAIPVQSRVNGQLGDELGDPIMAAATSFGGGLLLIVLLGPCLPAVRRGLRALPRAVVTRRIPPYYLAAGAVGAYLVFTQSAVVAVVGVAVFTVAVVAGQLVSGLVVDTVGFAQDTRRPPGALRLVGAGLVLAAVVLAASSSLGGSGPLLQLLAPAALALLAGLLTGFQHAMNGRIGAVTGSPLVAAATNFACGTTVLLLLVVLRWALGTHTEWSWPGQWWLYTGGIYGIVFIAGSAALVPRAGVLMVGLGSVTGQLLTSLLLDVLAPVADRAVAPSTVVGTALALVAISIASLPGRRRPAGAGMPRRG